MRIITKDNNKSKGFILKDIVWHQIGELKSVRDTDLMQPNCDGEEFGLGCLKYINKLYKTTHQKISKETLKEPSWKHFKDACNREWHARKSNNLFLRSYYYESKGWLKLKIDTNTPNEVYDKLGIQSKDRIRIKIDKHNERLDDDQRRIGTKPRGYLPKVDKE